MTKHVQLLGNNAEISITYVGFDRELTVDTDNRNLRLQDGVTPGGVEFLNRDANDARYQAKADELDGFLGWEPSQRGFLTRLGAASYKLRAIEVDTANMVLVNPLGYLGNPKFGLAETITSEHEWDGQQIFNAVVQFNAGLNGDTAGTHYGAVVGNVTGNLTGNSAGTHTGPTNGTHTGNVDTREGSLQLADEQILKRFLAPEILQYIINKGVPVGSILPFHGTEDAIPSNWRICDGTNGTPDLRSRFVMGYSAAHPYGETGGAETHTHATATQASGAHSHTLTVDPHALTEPELPQHKHFVANGITGPYGYLGSDQSIRASAEGSSSGASYWLGGDGSEPTLGKTSISGTGAGHVHTGVADLGGAHIHDVDNPAASNLPPYMALIYIKKVS